MATIALLPPRETWRPALRDLPIDADAGRILVGEERRLLTTQQQVVLAALLVSGPVGLDRLMHDLWGVWGEPPDYPLGAIRVHVCHLRKKLSGTGAVILTLHRRGYLLERAANDNQPAAGAAA